MILSRTNINRKIGDLFRYMGYEVRRKGQGFHADAYADQQILLSGDEVGVVFDVGANVGQTARHYRQIFPNAKIHSFEPFESTFRTLSENCRGDGRIATYQLAVTDFSGSRTFFFNEDSVSNSLLPERRHGRPGCSPQPHRYEGLRGRPDDDPG